MLLSNLPFTVKEVHNANSMSPEGTAPFVVFQLRNQPLILSNFEQMVGFLNAQVATIIVQCRLQKIESYASVDPLPDRL